MNLQVYVDKAIGLLTSQYGFLILIGLIAIGIMLMRAPSNPNVR